MSELRRDLTTGKWVLIAPERGRRRPRRWKYGPTAGVARARDEACPFCPGNEELLPAIVQETPGTDPPGWRTRVVPNKFPAVEPATAPGAGRGGPATVRPGYGRHEVIIDTPRHDADLALFSDEEAAALIATYRLRYAAMLEDARIRSVFVFRNYGQDAGASLRHPHSQVVALGIRPPDLRARDRRARRHFEDAGQCLLCGIAASERSEGLRLVDDNGAFVAFVPFAATHPFETWIVPTRHQASFAGIRAEEEESLAAILRSVLRRLRTVLDDPPYNFVIDSAAREGACAPHLHWRLRIAPDIVTPGGFELGSGLAINPDLPEEDAALLRTARPDPHDRPP